MTDAFDPDEIEVTIDDATDSYVKVKDIDGRACVMFPKTRGKAKGDNGDPYEFATADVIVLDGAITEMIDTIPCVVEDMRFSSGPIVRQVAKRLVSGTPLQGRINSQKGKFGNPAYGFGPLEHDGKDGEARKLAKREVGKYLAEKARIAAEGDPFEV